MSKKIKIVALIGESSAGKDAVQNEIIKILDKKTHKIVSYTTRPKRDYEENGIHYHFLSNEDFTKEILNGNMLEATEFRNWFYGTSLKSLDFNKINIGVFNPAGVESLLADSRLDVLVIKIQVSDKTRLQRALKREQAPDCAEICRRFLTDKKDFLNIEFDYIQVDAENLSPSEVAYEVIEQMVIKWTK